jgi:hypothetical protein
VAVATERRLAVIPGLRPTVCNLLRTSVLWHFDESHQSRMALRAPAQRLAAPRTTFDRSKVARRSVKSSKTPARRQGDSPQQTPNQTRSGSERTTEFWNKKSCSLPRPKVPGPHRNATALAGQCTFAKPRNPFMRRRLARIWPVPRDWLGGPSPPPYGMLVAPIERANCRSGPRPVKRQRHTDGR